MHSNFNPDLHFLLVSKSVTWSVILHLAFQSIGVVYGDIITTLRLPGHLH